MTLCCAVGCNNNGGHKFPKDPERRKKWIAAIKRKDWFPSKSSVLCSAHFRKEDYSTECHTTGKPLVNKSLRKDSVPTIFDRSSQLGKQKSVKRKASDQMPLNEEDDDDQSNLYEVHSINETEFEENQGMDPIGEGESNSELIKKTIASLERAKDEYTSFGEFVAHELRCINSVLLRKKLKRVIQKTILEIVEEDEQNQ
ncbi:THAP domain-containing protein 2-like isoform X3 [Cimex lectularius]|uniref:THAP-type domain-containing protein n=1 Tax=Cimex lectularius TaxID=79782 RepID=A0A8I6R9G0_CIMLE|nr:THAP domain-containing protein 2-like isoform X3 [Cimex lectularius]